MSEANPNPVTSTTPQVKPKVKRARAKKGTANDANGTAKKQQPTTEGSATKKDKQQVNEAKVVPAKKPEVTEKSKQCLSAFIKRGSLPSDKRPNPVEKHDQTQDHQFKFLPFQPKKDQSVAQYIPKHVLDRFKASLPSFELVYGQNDATKQQLYIEQLIAGHHCPVKHKKLALEKDVDVMELDVDQRKRQFKVKLLQFIENNRPPYYGTWTKSSNNVSGRKPFGNDDRLDYEEDSDEEWEDEDEAGDDCKEDDISEEEEKEEDKYEIDNDFLVPHGYLSDDEAEENDDDANDNNNPINGDDGDQKENGAPDDINPNEMKKHTILLEEKRLLSERKIQVKKPLVIQPIWESNPNDKATSSYAMLENYRGIFFDVPTLLDAKITNAA